MNIIVVVAIAVILFIIAVFLYQKLATSGAKKVIHAPVDPVAQASYNAQKHKNEKKQLSFKERLELSWKFLYEITEIILNKFSRQDQEEVREMGGVLVKNGVKYNHIVDLAIAPLLIKSKTQEVEVEQQHGEGRSL